MKNLIFSIMAILVFSACGSSTNNDDNGDTQEAFGRYGDTTFSADNAMPAASLVSILKTRSEIDTTIVGSITEACQAKGCWMKMTLNEDEQINVKFKDYGFFVPKNSGGHEAVMKGIASIDTISVAEQIEWAKDAEKSEEEIAEITEPIVKYSFVADGVIIR